MGRIQPYSSLSCFRQDPLVILTISGLIVVGGLDSSSGTTYRKRPGTGPAIAYMPRSCWQVRVC